MKQGRFGVCLAVAAILCAFPASSPAAIEPGLQFGTNGTGPGQFQVPVSVEVGPGGDLYVGDAITRRISQFSPDGTFVRAWGHDVIPANAETGFEKCTTDTGCKAGTNGGAAGQFASVDGIAAAANGDLYVAEFNNNRVSQFTANGDFIRAWGRDVEPPDGDSGFETCTAVPLGCLPGDSGTGLGQLQSPNSVAVRGTTVYVTETNGTRVSMFSTSGVPGGNFGTPGSGAGELSGPRGVAIAPGGNVLVVDRANNRVSEFDSGGTFVRAWGFGVDTGANAFETCTTVSGCQIGIAGDAAGQLSDGVGGEGVSGIEADSSGNVFLVDDTNNRIAQYAPSLAFTRAWGFDVDPAGATGFEECTTTCKQGVASAGAGGLANPSDVAIDSAGRKLVVDFQTDRVVRYADPAPPTPPPTDPGPTDPGPTDPGPTDPGPTDPNPNAKPSNDFEIGKAKLNSKKGNAKLPVDVPGAGELELEGKGVKPVTKDVTKAGTVQLPVKPKGKTADKLEDKGSAKVSLELTFTPTGGDPNDESKNVKLKQK